MGKRGPPPKPSALKQAQGTYRKGRAAPNEMRPTPGAPDCPANLDTIGREEWLRIVPELERISVLTLVDRAVLEGYCANYSLARQYQAVAELEPMVEIPLQTKGGGFAYVTKPNPAAAAARHHWTLVKQFATEFGLTPSARTHVSGTGGEKPAPSGAGPRAATDDPKKRTEGFLFGTGTSGRPSLQSIPGGRSGPSTPPPAPGGADAGV